MRSSGETLRSIDYDLKEMREQQDKLPALRHAPLDELEIEREKERLEEQVKRHRVNALQKLAHLQTFPERHLRHAAKLLDFFGVASFDRSVFLMTKYAKEGAPEAERLKAIVDPVSARVRNRT